MNVPLIRNPFRNRPPVAQYEAIEQYRKSLENLTPAQIMHHDAELWRDTVRHGAETPVANSPKTELIKRLFKIIRYGGALCCPNPDNPAAYAPWHYNIASCFSHGGRILIQTPKVSPLIANGSDHSFWLWLHGNAPLMKRVGTHSVKRFGERYQELTLKRLKFVAETGGVKHGAAQWFKQTFTQRASNVNTEASFGMNIAFGGFDSHGIVDDGTAGHLYFFYFPPDHQQCGAILVGLEGEAPGKWGQTGNFHSWNIGFIDWLRSNKPNKDMGLVSGPKWGALGKQEWMAGFVPSKKNGIFVDCSGIGHSRLERQAFDEEMMFQHIEPLDLVFPEVNLSLTQSASLNTIRHVYRTIPLEHCQARIDKLSAYRAEAVRLHNSVAQQESEEGIKKLITAREGSY